jgi:serine/threonine protein kinase
MGQATTDRAGEKTGEPRRVGDYRLVEPLGSGGMGEVYFAVSATADPVAVKLIKPSLVSGAGIRERFAAEVENLKLIYGSRVARLEDADPYGDPAWLAVEYVPGLTLKQYVEVRGVLSVRIAAMVGAMLADGLAKVHQGGLLHRDLKPQNVILGPSGPVLIDFGLAVLAQRDSDLTQTGVPVGTPAYMAPEQAESTKDFTSAVDIYGLGATLAFALTGHMLYSTTNWYPLLKRIADPADLPDLTGVPAELAHLIGAMLAFDPSARPALGTVRTGLLAVATGGGESAAEMRSKVAEITYDATRKIEIPADLEDPSQDAEQAGDDERRENSTGDESFDPSTPGAERTPASTPRTDLTWLVEKLRAQYRRRSSL